MTIKEALNYGVENLLHFERPMLESEILLAFVLNKDRIYLHANDNKILQKEHVDFYTYYIYRRKNYEPIEYITNKVSFYGFEFYISRGALIPRPESEILVDKAIEIINKFNITNIAEIGIGSGILSIAISLLSDKNININASDISPEALYNAYININRFKLKNITLHKSSYLNYTNNNTFELIISNPPYIQNNKQLPQELSYEPRNALFGGNNGDEIIQEIIQIALRSNTKFLICEIGHDQKEPILCFLKDKKHKNIEFYKDLSGLDRGFVLYI